MCPVGFTGTPLPGSWPEDSPRSSGGRLCPLASFQYPRSRKQFFDTSDQHQAAPLCDRPRHECDWAGGSRSAVCAGNLSGAAAAVCDNLWRWTCLQGLGGTVENRRMSVDVGHRAALVRYPALRITAAIPLQGHDQVEVEVLDLSCIHFEHRECGTSSPAPAL